MFRHLHPISSVAFAILLGAGMISTEAKRSAQSSSSGAALRLSATLSGHTKNIIAESFSLDGRIIATGSEDGTVRLWDSQTGQEKATLEIKVNTRSMQLEWSLDGNLLAVKHDYGGRRIQVWDVRAARLRATLDTRDGDAAVTLAWSPDSRTLLTSGYQGKATLWNAETGSLGATLIQDPPRPKQSFSKRMGAAKSKATPGRVKAYFVADGSVLTLSSGNSPKLWDETGHLKVNLPLTEERPEEQFFSYPTDAVISPDRRLVAARYDANGVALLDTATGRVKYSLGEIGEPLGFSHDGRRLLVLKRKSKRGEPCFQVGCELNIYDFTSGQLLVTFEKMSGDIERYWSPNGIAIVTVSGTILNTRNGRVSQLPYEACTPDRIIGSPQCDPFIFSSDGRMLKKLKNPLKLWDAETGQLLARIDGGLSLAAFSPTNSSLLLTRGKDKRAALVWRIEGRDRVSNRGGLSSDPH